MLWPQPQVSSARRPWISMVLALVLALLWLVERWIPSLPPALQLALVDGYAAMRWYPPPLTQPWQWWTGALIRHDALHLMVATTLWCTWGRALELRAGPWLFSAILAAGLPLMILAQALWWPAQHPALLAADVLLLSGLSSGTQAGALRGVWLQPGLTVWTLRPFLWPAIVWLMLVLSLEILRRALVDTGPWLQALIAACGPSLSSLALAWVLGFSLRSALAGR